MPIKIKVDEDLPRLAVHVLREHGYDAANVIEQGMGGWKDPKLWEAIQVEERFLVTADKGFANIQKYPPGKHVGVLLLRPDQDGIRPVMDLLNQVLNSYQLHDLAGTITVATQRGIRVRKGYNVSVGRAGTSSSSSFFTSCPAVEPCSDCGTFYGQLGKVGRIRVSGVKCYIAGKRNAKSFCITYQ